MNLVQPLQYTPFVKPYVEGAHKEYKELQDRLIKDYDEAVIQYDALKEAADNMQSLDAPNDKAAKEEAFKKAYGYIDEATRMGDFENRGRIVRKAIREFTSDYKTIAKQVEDRKTFREELDKMVRSNNLESSKAEELKEFIDRLYRESGGLKKDKISNNVIGYSNYIKNPPKTVDFIDKISKAFSGVKEDKIKKEWEEIIKNTGTDYDNMMRKTHKLIEQIPQGKIKNIVMQVIKDPEVSDYLDFWTTISSYKAPKELAISYLNRDLEEQKLILLNKEPKKYKKYTDEQLTLEAKTILANSGRNIDEIMLKLEDNPNIASNIVKQGKINDKFRELFGFSVDKYGAVTRDTGYSFSGIEGVSSGLANKLAAQGIVSLPEPFTKKSYDVQDNETYEQEKKDVLKAPMSELAIALGRINKDTPDSQREHVAEWLISNTYKVTPEEEKKGITPLSKGIKALELQLVKTLDAGKKREIQSTIEGLKIADIKYQDLINTRKELEVYLRKNIGKPYDDYKAFLEEINTYPFSNRIKAESQEKVINDINKFTKQFNETKNKISNIPTYSKIGETVSELQSSEDLINKLQNKNWLEANLSTLQGYSLENNQLGERLSLKQILGTNSLNYLNNEKLVVSAAYIKAPITTKDGKSEPGVLLKLSKDNKPVKTIFLPGGREGINTNELMNLSINKNSFDNIVDLARAGTANSYRLGKINEVISVGDKQIDLSKKDYYLIFDEDRNNYQLLDEEAYNKTMETDKVTTKQAKQAKQVKVSKTPSVSLPQR